MTELTQEMLLALETGSISVVELLQEIDALAKKDSIQAEELLVTLKESTNLSYNILVKYLHNKIREERQNVEISEEEKTIRDEYLDAGRNYLKSKQYEEALKTFKKAYSDTNNSIFLYYLGKTYFRMNKMTLATEYFFNYIDNGYENFVKANFYLWVQSKRCNNRRARKYRQAIVYYIPEIFPDEETFSTIRTKNWQPELGLIVPSRIEVKTTCLQQIDHKGQKEDEEDNNAKMFRELMSETEEEARRKLFGTLDFYYKLSMIDKMYSEGNFLVGDNFLQQVLPSAMNNPKRQKQINQLKVKKNVYRKNFK